MHKPQAICHIKIIRKDRLGKRGGGVCVLLQNNIEFKLVQIDSTDIHSDILCFDILGFSFDHLRFIAVYRPPKQSSSDDEILCNLLVDLCSSSPNVVILGDLNLDIDWSKIESPLAKQNKFNRFISLFSMLSLKQHCFTTPNLVVNAVIEPPLGTSDHNIVVFSIETEERSLAKRVYKDYTKANKEAIIAELNTIDWFTIFHNYQSIDDVYDRFLLVLHSLIDQFVPVKVFTHFSESYPPYIRNLYQQRERLFRVLDNPLTSAEYKRVNKDFTFHLRRYLAFKERKMAKCRNMKTLFAYISKRLSKKNRSSCLYDNSGHLLTTAPEKANALGEYFATVFSPTENGGLSFPCRVRSDCPLPVIDPTQVYKYLKKIKSSASLPSDGIPAIFYKIMNARMNEVVDRLSEFTRDWGLELNFNKTCVLTLGKRSSELSLTNIPSSSIVTQTRDLGVTVSSSMTWDRHIDDITTRALRCLFSLFRTVKSSD
ncbi:hypothetical protein COOONC_17068, partial [Cooperia oncophora]